MPSSNSLILLDTMVVAGLLSLTKKISKTSGDFNTKQWQKSISDLISTSKIKNYLLRIPTPVCYELMCWNQEWFNFVNSPNTELADLFRFNRCDITHDILKKAAEFSFKSQTVHFDGNKKKVTSMDPIIAAYSLIKGHYLLTLNQNDFPESHFKVAAMTPLLKKVKKGILRESLFLLVPKKQ